MIINENGWGNKTPKAEDKEIVRAKKIKAIKEELESAAKDNGEENAEQE